MPPKRRPFLRVLLNPLVLSLAVVLALTAGWLLYTGGGNSGAQARPGANLLPALDSVPPGAVTASGGAIGGWNASHSGDATTSLKLIDGQLGKHALKFNVSRYASGDVTLTSPRVDVVPGQRYLFKAFAAGNADFTLLLRRYHADGGTTLEQLRNPLERPGNATFAVSDAFDSGESTTAVQYVFRLASKGTLRLEGGYLEAADDVRVTPSPTTGLNLIPNPGLAGPRPGAPGSWSPYTSGTSKVTSGLSEDENGSFLWTRIANYQGGEAKWQYRPVPVTAERYLEFGATYQSERDVDVVAEFGLADGGRVFHNLATVPPAGEWTKITEAFQVPAGAITAMVTLVSHGDGTTGVRDYSLTDATRPGPVRWKQPLVSITFDDGRQSVHDLALPLLDKHGFASTQYVNAGAIETPGFMTAAELGQMHEAGHEIASHGYGHVDLTSIGVERLEEELRKGKESLAAAGLDPENFALPFGRTDPQVDWHAGTYFETVRGTRSGINTRQNLDPQDLKVFYVSSQTTQESLAKALAQASLANGWLILVYEQIQDPASTATGADGSTVGSDALAAQLQLIKDSGIAVQPVARAFEKLQGQ